MQVGGGEHGLRLRLGLAPSQESEADSFATDAGFEAERVRLAAEAEVPPPPPKDAPDVAARRGKFDTRCPTGHQIPRTPVLTTAAAAAPAKGGLLPRAVAAPAVAVRQAFPSFAVQCD
jgi:hypothetical protein